MKYKVVDEVLVKARIIEVKEEENVQYKIKRCGNPVPYNFASGIYVGESDIVPQPQMTAEEVWEIAKNLFDNYSNAELDDIFGKGWSFQKLMELTPQEAKAKIEAWEQKREINVGDEVRIKEDPGDEYKFFVTDKDDFEISGFSGFNGSVFSCRDISLYEKTGRHIDIDGLLKKIGVDE